MKKLPQLRNAVRGTLKKRWVRFALGVAVCAGFYQAGASASDPRMPDNQPGYATPPEMLYGKWDGIATLPDGSTFCLVGWPCEKDDSK